jgi:hypothetical protein
MAGLVPAIQLRASASNDSSVEASHSPRRRAAAGWQARWPAMVKQMYRRTHIARPQTPPSPWQGLSLPSSCERPRAMTLLSACEVLFAAPTRGGWMAGPVACHGETNVWQDTHREAAIPSFTLAGLVPAMVKFGDCWGALMLSRIRDSIVESGNGQGESHTCP